MRERERERERGRDRERERERQKERERELSSTRAVLHGPHLSEKVIDTAVCGDNALT